jgi:hypothetical protein
MPRYKEYVVKMIEENKDIFDEFKILHDRYEQDQENLQEEYNAKGAKITDLVRDYENRLCANTERGAFVKFSGNLAEKFHEELRKVFPMIDHIGLIVTKAPVKTVDLDQEFSLKKISL